MLSKEKKINIISESESKRTRQIEKIAKREIQLYQLFFNKILYFCLEIYKLQCLFTWNASLTVINNSEQECIPVGCVPPAPLVDRISQHALLQGGAWSGGCLVPRGCLLQGGAWFRGDLVLGWVPALEGGGIPACTEANPPPEDRILDTRFWKYYLAPNFICRWYQECIPAGCVPPAHWPYPIVSQRCLPNTPPPRCRSPGCRPPQMQPSPRMQTPLDAETPWCRPPSHLICDACWEVTPAPPPWT